MSSQSFWRCIVPKWVHSCTKNEYVPMGTSLQFYDIGTFYCQYWKSTNTFNMYKYINWYIFQFLYIWMFELILNVQDIGYWYIFKICTLMYLYQKYTKRQKSTLCRIGIFSKTLPSLGLFWEIIPILGLKGLNMKEILTSGTHVHGYDRV